MAESIADRWVALLHAIDQVAPASVVWKNADRTLAGEGDLDVIAAASDLDAIERAFRAWATDARDVMVCRHVPGALFCVATGGDGHRYEVDVKTRGTLRGGRVLDAPAAARFSVEDERGFRRLRPGAEGVFKLILNGMRRGGRPRDERIARERIAELVTSDPDGVAAAAATFGPARTAVLALAGAVARGAWSRRAALTVEALVAARAAGAPRRSAQRAWFKATRARECPGLKSLLDTVTPDRMRTIALRHAGSQITTGGARGGTILIAGPDGVGKTTLTEGLIATVFDGVPIKRIHHRDGLGILPRRMQSDGPSREPHGKPAYPLSVALAKVAYLWFDFTVGWLVNVTPFTRRGGWVVMERGWWDVVIDPTRYRLQRTEGLTRLLARFVPQPDLILVLEAPPEVVTARKDELPPAELTRQMRAWRRLLPTRQRRVTLDAERPASEVIDVAARAVEAVRRGDAGSPRSWVALPRRTAPRMFVPRDRAAAGLRVFHPVTPRGRAAHAGATRLARAGLARLAPGAAPPQEIVDAVADEIPDGGSAAFARTTHDGRWIALLLDADGSEQGVAKIATTAAGRDALAREAAALEALPDLAPVRVPVVRSKRDGVLVFAPVAWRARPHAGALPTEVAAALGRSTANGLRIEDGFPVGPSHGDAAPWNLLRDARGWILIDWESACDAPAFTDVFHYLVQAHALLGTGSARAIVDAAAGAGPLAPVVAAYATSAGVDPALAPRALEAYLRSSLAALTPDRDDHRRGIRARRHLLEVIERG